MQHPNYRTGTGNIPKSLATLLANTQPSCAIPEEHCHLDDDSDYSSDQEDPCIRDYGQSGRYKLDLLAKQPLVNSRLDEGIKRHDYLKHQSLSRLRRTEQ